MNQEYIVTIRKGIHLLTILFTSEGGVDLLLNVNANGRLVFPDELFQEAKKILDDAKTS